jgi:hypothetical protein
MEKQNDDDLNFENEFMKLKITAESGAYFSDNNLPPKVENDFLKYMMAFEEAAKEKKVVKFFDKIERPDFSLNVDDQWLRAELERLLNHLEKYHINVSSICEVSDRELYRFIVEDLFEEIINDVPLLEGGYNCFTYEDFYPNHPHDIGNRVDEFRQVLIDKKVSLYSWVFSSEFQSKSGMKLNEELVLTYLDYYFNKYQSITIPIFEIKELEIEGNSAVQIVYIKIETTTNPDSTPITFEGQGKITLENTFSWWCISGIDIPGLQI